MKILKMDRQPLMRGGFVSKWGVNPSANYTHKLTFMRDETKTTRTSQFPLKKC